MCFHCCLQVVVFPGQLLVDPTDSSAIEFSIGLLQQPSADVLVSITVPNAWDGGPIADVNPQQLAFTPDTWEFKQNIVLLPKQVCEGDYYITAHLTAT
jgi:hypothetical protein